MMGSKNPILIGIGFLLAVYLIYIYPVRSLNHFFFGAEIFSLYSLLMTGPVAMLVFFYFRSHNTFWLLKDFTYLGLGCGFIGFWVVNVGLILEAWNTVNPNSIGLGCVTLIIVTMLFSFLNSKFICIKKIDLVSDKIQRSRRVVFLSDTHLGSNSKKHLLKIIKKLSEIEFDLIIIGGDFIDSSSFNLRDLGVLVEIDRPILYITGNHEYYLQDYMKKLATLSSLGVRLLENKSFEIAGLNIIGVDDFQNLASQENVVKELIKESVFNLVVVHKPYLWNKKIEGVDLMLSGHTHNGQIFPFNLFIKLYSKQTYGLYERLGSLLYVSSGSGCWGPKMRLGSRNEIVVLEISPDQEFNHPVASG